MKMYLVYAALIAAAGFYLADTGSDTIKQVNNDRMEMIDEMTR